MLDWIAVTAGLAFLIIGIAGLRNARRLHLSRPRRLLMWTIVVAVGASSTMLSYRLDSRTRVFGVPLPAAFLQRNESGVWQDFVGPFSAPFMLLDALLNAGVALYVISKLAALRPAAGKTGSTTEPSA